MMQIDKKKAEQRVKYILIICVALFFMFLGFRKHFALKNNGNFTVGIISIVGAGSYGSYIVFYHFEVNNMRYKGKITNISNNIEKGKKYLIVFSEENPDISQIFLDIELNDDYKLGDILSEYKSYDLDIPW